MKISNIYTKDIQILESLMEGSDNETRHYLRVMQENFVVPYSNYLIQVFRRLDEAELTPDQVTQIFGTVSQNLQASGGNETFLGKLLPDSIKKKFADSLPEPDAGAVEGFEEKANAALSQVQDPAAKQSLGALIKQGIQNPTTQKLIIAGVQGVAGVVAGALTGGMGGKLGATAAGAITGGLVGLIAAKLQGQDWKSAAKSGLKGAAVGGAGGLIGSVAGGLVGAALPDNTKPDPSGTPGATGPGTPEWSLGGGQGDLGLKTPAEPQEYIIQPGDTLSQIAQRNNQSVYDLMQSNPEIKNPDVIRAGQKIIIDPPTGNTTYAGAVGTASDTMLRGIPTGDYADSQISRNMYARTRAESKNNLKKPLREYFDKELTVFMWAVNESVGKPRGGVHLTEAGVGGIVSSIGSWLKTKGQNLTQKVTPDKLMQAWNKAGKPTDSDKLAEFLEKQGIPKEVIQSVYQSMSIPMAAGGDERKEPTLDLDATPAPAPEPAPAPALTPDQLQRIQASLPTTSDTELQRRLDRLKNANRGAGDPVHDLYQKELDKRKSGEAPAPSPAPAPAPASGTSIFADPDKLMASWNAYIQAGGKWTPAFRGTLKEILLTALRTVESRQRKINKIVKEARRIKGQLIELKKQRL